MAFMGRAGTPLIVDLHVSHRDGEDDLRASLHFLKDLRNGSRCDTPMHVVTGVPNLCSTIPTMSAASRCLSPNTFRVGLTMVKVYTTRGQSHEEGE
jgi:hypothetical protein